MARKKKTNWLYHIKYVITATNELYNMKVQQGAILKKSLKNIEDVGYLSGITDLRFRIFKRYAT